MRCHGISSASVACGGDAMVFGGGGRRYTLFCQTQDGHTALILASANSRADCVRLLIDAGADKEAKSNVRHMMIRFGQCFLFPKLSILSGGCTRAGYARQRQRRGEGRA